MSEKPSIYIYHSPEKQLNEFKQILFGMEEEGLPYKVLGRGGNKALDLAHPASLDSPLGVGIGIGQLGDVALHFVKLNKDEPLFEVNLNQGPVILRALGANAARLVKGIPFKELMETNDLNESQTQRLVKTYEEIPQATSQNLTKEDIELIVAKVLNILQDKLGG